jgi:hypothetical protein
MAWIQDVHPVQQTRVRRDAQPLLIALRIIARASCRGLENSESTRYLDVKVVFQIDKSGGELALCALALRLGNLIDPAVLHYSQSTEQEKEAAENPQSA